MKQLLPILVLLAGCHSAETFLDAGPDGTGGGGDDAPDAADGEADLRPWTGTATVSSTDFNGITEQIDVEVTWTAVAHDEDGVDYEPSGTVTMARTYPGCTVSIDPATAPIAGDNGSLRVDDDGTYRGFAGTYWNVTYTTTCPPSAPATMQTLVTTMWLNAATPRPVTAADLLSGDETMGAFHMQWTFTR